MSTDEGVSNMSHVSASSSLTSFDSIKSWSCSDVKNWLLSLKTCQNIITLLCDENEIDGKGLLVLTPKDIDSLNIPTLGARKRLLFDILELQNSHNFHPNSFKNPPHFSSPLSQFSSPPLLTNCISNSSKIKNKTKWRNKKRRHFESESSCSSSSEKEELYENYNYENVNGEENEKNKVKSPTTAVNYENNGGGRGRGFGGYATNLEAEIGKTFLAMCYLIGVTWVTSLTMVIVHDRVPDMEKWPPLPDLFLDNMPHIPWAFEMCEITGTVLLSLFLCVLFFHKHRFILIRRFFALSGTVFLLRCVTMLITSLSVPGAHLKCNPRPNGDLVSKIHNAYIIWKGAGMSIQGVRTCGDYMFSGHTSALTMLNFFVTEYTSRKMYYVHTFSWLLNMFGIFFILAAHEHYSIDVFIAFYITSRLFLYYHTLANNQALMQRDSKRTKIWFPLFSYFESKVNGIVPNHYEWPLTTKRVKKFSLFILRLLEKRWKELVPHPSEGFFRTKFFFRPSSAATGIKKE